MLRQQVCGLSLPITRQCDSVRISASGTMKVQSVTDHSPQFGLKTSVCGCHTEEYTLIHTDSGLFCRGEGKVGVFSLRFQTLLPRLNPGAVVMRPVK